MSQRTRPLDDLIGLGVGSVGHCRKLLDSIAFLRAGASSGTIPT
jgi:hypothetical protein